MKKKHAGKSQRRRNTVRTAHQYALAPSELRWRCSPEDPGLTATTNVSPATEIIGQDRALRALRIGLDMDHHGYNIFVNGVSGTGRTTTVKRLLREFEHRQVPLTDKCYVHNFHDEDAPAMLAFPAGQGAAFKKDMETLVSDLLKGVPALFESKRYQQERKGMLEHFQDRQRTVLKDFEKKVKERGFEVVQVQAGPSVRPEIAPVVEGTPISIDQLQTKVDAGEMSEEQVKELTTKQSDLESQMDLVMREMRNIERKAKKSLDQLNHRAVVPLVEELLEELLAKYAAPRVKEYVGEVKKSILENIARFHQKEEQQTSVLGVQVQRDEDPFLEYQVNVVVDNGDVKGRPVIIETNPKYKNLFGTIDRIVDRQGVWRTDFTQIKAGSLIKADGGFLVVNAIDALVEPWVWTTLKRVMRNGQIEIQPIESGIFGNSSGLKPEPITLSVKVVMIGDSYVYHLLHQLDDDFRKIFKIRADFDVEMPNDDKSISSYTAFIRSLCDAERLLPFDAGAVAEVVEHGVRLAGRKSKLSTRFNSVADAIREASYWAGKSGATTVSGEHVRRAIEEHIERVRMVEDKIQEMIVEGTLMIATEGSAVGQINGLSVYMMGDYEFGKPTRITAKTAMGRGGIINIEREADLSGPTHNKGVLILGGYLRWKYAQHRQLMLSASIAFEQSYVGVDGDSASSTEVYALLSGLSGIPIRQDLAVTGSINQHGEIQPIGGVNMKIEGFFDVCRVRGLTGTQGVIIPRQNVGDLMLRHDVVEAVAGGKFHIYAISSVDEGIGLLMDMPAGHQKKDGSFSPARSIHALVEKRLKEYAKKQR